MANKLKAFNNEIIKANAKIKKYGTASPPLINRNKCSWRAGWRTIANKQYYFRSRWEANYARYLEWLKKNKKIKEWEYESDTFWFEKIQRGVRSYKPDFKVFENNGTYHYDEVKGWMDDRSKTTLRRMEKYYPNICVNIIDGKFMKSLNKIKALIDKWE